MNKCRSCGAPLPESGICEYCGSEYNRIEKIDDVYYKINYGGSEHVCFINGVKVDILYAGSPGRNIDGEIIKTQTIRKLRFELVEV